MNGMKMKKCFGKTHSVVKLLLILWMTSLIHIAVGETTPGTTQGTTTGTTTSTTPGTTPASTPGTAPATTPGTTPDVFHCSGSNMNVSMTLVCDGLYDCDNYEDESLCNYSATYLQEGESHLISLPQTTTTRLYNAYLLQTNTTNGFRVQLRRLYLSYEVEVKIGTGNDPSDVQSVITTIHGKIVYAPDDVYVDTNEMWFAVIGAKGETVLYMDVEIISIDLSTLIACSSSNMSVSPTVLCDGLYQCDHYEDELACTRLLETKYMTA